MKVGLVIYGRLDTVSGGYLYDRRLVEHLQAQGDEVTVVALPWSCYGRHLLHNLSPSLAARLRRAGFDLLLQDELNHPSLFWLNRRLKLPYPLVSIVHHLRQSETHPRWQMALYRPLEQAYLRSVEGFIYNSQTTRQTVEALAGSRPCVVAPPAGNRLPAALTTAEITARARAAGPLRILFVGNVIRRKGVHTLLAACAQLPRPDWTLAVVGDTAVDRAYTAQLLRQVEAAGLQTAVTWHGPLPDAALAQLMGHSHLLAVPSQYEGFGIVYLEGMAFGLPAIAGAAGAAGEIITEGENGYRVPAGDTAVLADRLGRLHQDRALLARLGLAARARFLSWPTWSQSMTAVRHFLQQMAERSKA